MDLVFLDLSAAFDTIDHNILIARLNSNLGISEPALSWFKEYLSDRSQRVSINGSICNKFIISSGVPQGSCLGPLLFIIYASDLFKVLNKHSVKAHAYADDSQLYLSFKPGHIDNQNAATNTITNCIKDIQRWMTCSKLKMNDGKTEFMITGTRQQLSKQSINHLTVGTSSIEPSSSVRNLGTISDTNLSSDKQIASTCKSSFYYLYDIRKIRKFLSPSSCATLVNAFITCRIDYCNSLYYGLPAYQIAKLQRLQNAAARLVSLTPRFSHITPVLADLHWLPVRFKIRFKILIFVFRVIHGLAPSYLSDLISIRTQSS